MSLDVAKIDEYIDKLQQLRKLAADPEMAKVFAEFQLRDQETISDLTLPAASTGNGSGVLSLLGEMSANTLSQRQAQARLRAWRVWWIVGLLIAAFAAVLWLSNWSSLSL